MSETKYKKIDLNEVMLKMSEETKKEIHSIGDHKLFIGILDAHTEIISDTMDEKLLGFANTSWDELMKFITNEYEGLGAKLSEQTCLIKQVKGDVFEVHRELGILKQDFKKANSKFNKQLRDHDNRIAELEKKVKDITTKINPQ